MGIEEYFKRNGILKKALEEATDDQREVRKLDNTERWDEHFKRDIDVFTDCVDYDINIGLFDILLEEAKKYSDIFEPCCQSGILGCYLTSELKDVSYKGIDINPFAIEKAKKRAKANNLSPEIFEQKDKSDYKQQHEAVIGRFVANRDDRYFGFGTVDDEAVDFLSRTSKNIVLVQPSHPYFVVSTIQEYMRSFRKHGYHMVMLCTPKESPATGGAYFVIKATKH